MTVFSLEELLELLVSDDSDEDSSSEVEVLSSAFFLKNVLTELNKVSFFYFASFEDVVFFFLF